MFKYWRQVLCRIIGLACLGGGLFAFYDFGIELLPLFEQFLLKTQDTFSVFITFSSFFFGAIALVWVGTRFIALRSFSSTWLFYAILPIVAWLQRLFNIEYVYDMDRILSQYVVYGGIYVYLMCILRFVHTYWFTPLSHDDMRHVPLEQWKGSAHPILKIILAFCILFGLLILHPTDINTTLTMLFSPIMHLKAQLW